MKMEILEFKNKTKSTFYMATLALILGMSCGSQFALAEEDIIIYCDGVTDPTEPNSTASVEDDASIECAPPGGYPSPGLGGSIGPGFGGGDDSGGFGGGGSLPPPEPEPEPETREQCLVQSQKNHNSCIQLVDGTAIGNLAICAVLWETGPIAAICAATAGILHEVQEYFCNDMKIEHDRTCKSKE